MIHPCFVLRNFLIIQRVFKAMCIHVSFVEFEIDMHHMFMYSETIDRIPNIHPTKSNRPQLLNGLLSYS